MGTKFNGFNIDSFKHNFINGARGYLFYVIPNFPPAVGSSGNFPNPVYLVRSSSIPSRTVEPISVPFQGYDYKIGGKSTVEDWTVTFTVDKEAGLYKKYMNWMDIIHNLETNFHGDPKDYMVDQSVQLLNNDGTDAILDVELFSCWPTSVASLELAYDGNEILTFDVTFAYLRHKIVNL